MTKQGSDGIAPGSRIGKYEMVRLIGAGGMGSVYEGLHVELKKRVAIKTLHPELALRKTARQRFLREGEAASRIRHPHVVDVTDVDTHDGMPYLVMEFLEGLDLKQTIVQKGPMSATETVDLLLPAIAAIAAGHDEGVIHRDLKPHNIFLAHTRTGEIIAKVLDFGVSKLTDPATGGPSLTGTAAIMGTVAYMSPEQAKGAKFVDGRTDQYAMSLILYECLTGKRPHRGENTLAVLRQIGDGTIDPPRVHAAALPAEMEAVILKGLSVKPDNRFPSLYAFGKALLPFATERVRAVWGPTFDREPQEQSGSSWGESQDEAPQAAAAEEPSDLPVPVRASNAPANDDLESEATALGTVPLRATGRESGRVSAGRDSATPARESGRRTAAAPARDSGRRTGAAPTPERGTARRAASTPVSAPVHADSTLGHSAAELELPENVPPRPVPRQGSRTAVGVGLALAGAVVAFVVVVMVARRPESALRPTPPAPAAPPPTAAAPAPPRTLRIDVSAIPKDAEIMLDGVREGRGSLVKEVAGDRPHMLRVSAPGYEVKTMSFIDAPPPRTITLVKLPEAPRRKPLPVRPAPAPGAPATSPSEAPAEEKPAAPLDPAPP